MTDRELIDRAFAAMALSYSPYSKFAVGAAVECDNNTVFTGCNVENASFGATICAETVAITSAIAAGKRKFTRIAIISDADSYTYPCGICRQILLELAPDVEVLSAKFNKSYVSYKISELQPKPFQFRG